MIKNCQDETVDHSAAVWRKKKSFKEFQMSFNSIFKFLSFLSGILNFLIRTVLRQIFVHCDTFSSTFAAFPRPSCYKANTTNSKGIVAKCENEISALEILKNLYWFRFYEG